MGGGKQRKKKNLNKEKPETAVFSNYSAPARNMRKADLGAVIFGCKHNTIEECLSNQLFGLPASHFSYIKNINEGLALFLFNYSDRKLHGIFEAASHGQMNINRYAWVADGDDYEYTSYPAQVRIRVRQQCQPLSEHQFGPIIADNYYENALFYFELDRDQTNKLISLFTSSPMNQFNSRGNNEIKGQAGNDMQNWESEAGFDQEDANGSSWASLADNPNQTSKISYASVVSNIRTSTTTTSLPIGKWSALFNTQSAPEATKEDERDKVVARDCDGVGFGELPPIQSYDDPWEESQLTATATNESEWDPTWALVPSPHHLNEPSSSPRFDTQSHSANIPLPDVADDIQNLEDEPLDDNLACKLSCSSTKTNESNEEESHEKCSSLVVSVVTDTSPDLESLVVKLMQEVEMLKGSQLKEIEKTNLLEKQVVESKQEIQQLTNRLSMLESSSQLVPAEADDQQLSRSHSNFIDYVLIVGGCDGSSWLPTLDSYFPSLDTKRSLTSMNFVKRYASAATLNGEVYHFGGTGTYTVESFNPTTNQWVRRPPLYWNNEWAAGASFKDTLFSIGGRNGCHCCSEVEYLDLNIGKWFPTRSMQSKRLALAAAELNNALYVVGGHDGNTYLSSVERFDPREGAWYELQSMNARRGCHSLVVLNEKLYALGGRDGDNYIPTVEVFEHRMGSWMTREPMNVSRGNFGAFVLREKLYVIGGSKEQDEVIDTIEFYEEGRGWEVTALKAIGKRSHFSAIVL